MRTIPIHAVASLQIAPRLTFHRSRQRPDQTVEIIIPMTQGLNAALGKTAPLKLADPLLVECQKRMRHRTRKSLDSLNQRLNGRNPDRHNVAGALPRQPGIEVRGGTAIADEFFILIERLEMPPVGAVDQLLPELFELVVLAGGLPGEVGKVEMFEVVPDSCRGYMLSGMPSEKNCQR